jgi:hypothetical protein
MGVQPKHVAADLPEPVNVGFARGAPVDEMDAQLERRLGLADHLQRIDAGERQVIADVRNRGLAHPDRRDLVGLDEPDLDLAQPLREHRRRHPAGGATADDRHSAYWLISAHHVPRFLSAR